MKKHVLILLFFILNLSYSYAQDAKVLKDVKSERSWTINFSEAANLLQISAAPEQFVAPEVGMTSSDVKRAIDAKRHRKYKYLNKTYREGKEDIKPMVTSGFTGKPLGSAGIPNDNTMAVSNGGILISAINTTVTILDEQGTVKKFTTLSSLTKGQLGLLDRYYDPKVLYDPVSDRFILVFLEGSTSSDTRIIVGFTQSNDPTQDWNFYQLNGKPLGGTTWSDYPIIAHNKEDLFITVNLLRDNESWQEGFVQSFIWQVSKADGYAGNTLGQQLFYDINYNNKAVWSICPVQPADGFDQENMYFLSVRPGDASNDTVFLHEISHSLSSGKAKHSLKVLISDLAYGVPPSAFQPELGYRLQTNDTRVLSATLLQNRIYYVQSSLVPDLLSSGIYYGLVDNLSGKPTISAKLIGSETLDYAYPSISYTGLNPDLKSMLITFSHVGELDYPGTSVMFSNAIGHLTQMLSEPIMVKEGEDLIDTFVEDSLERWGDYTDIQRKYNEPGVVWLAGSFGDINARNNVWMAKVSANHQLSLLEGVISYPNPASNSIHIAANFKEEGLVHLELVDMQGRIVRELRDQKVLPIATEFLVNTSGIATGAYTISIKDVKGNILHKQKLIIQSIP